MKKKIITGNFTLKSGQTFPGKLKIRGNKSVLTVYCGSETPEEIGNQTIHGTSHVGEKITLTECISFGPNFSFSRTHSVTIEFYFSHILIGNVNIEPDSTKITRVRFRTRDTDKLLSDLRDFHYDRMTKESANLLIKDSSRKHVNIGDHPQVCYFSGRYLVFELSTSVGKFWIENSPSTKVGSFKGLQMTNKVFVNMEFEVGKLFDGAIRVIHDLSCLMSVIAGQTQREKSITIFVNENEWLTLLNTIDEAQEEDSGYIHRGDLPIDPIKRPEEFSRVMLQWFERHEKWHIPRYRWASCQAKGSLYDIDRLVAAANMLDILPDGATPKENILSEDLKKAKETCRSIFENLSDSLERSSVLGALGRLNKPSLPQKCKHRVSLIENAMQQPFVDLSFVTSIAIKLRNHFVHGTPFRGLDETLELMPFLTDTLEFVFIASDLIECEWKILDWHSRKLGSGHSMSRYIRNYFARCTELRKIHPNKLS